MSLPLSGDMLPSELLSRMRALLSIEHQECLFLLYASLRQLPSDVRSGKENVVADALSQPVSPSSAPNPESNPSSVSPSPTKPCSNSNPSPSSFQSPSKPVKPHAFPAPGALPPVVSEVSEATEVSGSFPTVFLTIFLQCS